MSKPPILKITNLSFAYKNGKTALKDINLIVQPGEFIAVIGLSGSGKSTLLKCINRLLDPTLGKVEFLNRDITKVTGQELSLIRKNMGMIFQNFNLISRFSVITNVLVGRLAEASLFRSLLFLFSKSEFSAAQKCLTQVGLRGLENRRAGSLSGGQQQRVAIARTLLQNPQLLLADEPVASLDPATSYGIMDQLKKINQDLGITVLCNLHFLSLVREYATRVIALKDGEILYDGPANSIDNEWFKKIYGQDAREISVQ